MLESRGCSLFLFFEMNFLHVHHRKLSEIVPVPEGLRELMADMTREVLRYQPENVEKFIADYLDAMLLTRELYTIADRTIEDLLDSSFQIIEILQKVGIDQSQSELVVKVIKDEFKKHKEEMPKNEPLREFDIINRLINECKLTVEQAQKTSEIIENAWDHYYQFNTEQRSKIDPNLAHFEAVKKTLSIYKKSKPPCNEVNKSAKVLIAGFKGYLERNDQVTTRKYGSSIAYDANWRSPNFQNREQAATKIQAWFRGLKDRRHFMKAIKAATKIQACFKGYQARKKLKRRMTERASVKPDITREKAAILIQSYYRAYKMRKHFKIQKKAAIVIQAQFRKFLSHNRKKTQELTRELNLTLPYQQTST